MEIKYGKDRENKKMEEEEKVKCTDCGKGHKLGPSYNEEFGDFLIPYFIHSKYRKWAKFITWLWGLSFSLSVVGIVIVEDHTPVKFGLAFFMCISMWMFFRTIDKYPTGLGMCSLLPEEVRRLKYNQGKDGSWSISCKLETGYTLKQTHLQDVEAFIQAQQKTDEIM